ncbi:hypothetical protein FA568_00590 [Pseudomonas aeruginosa]|nr:hypothetical protein [Pseudomonas aeruginosa]MDV6937944.1 hypothetical protein [Pseudomonas aeruginosa]MDV6959057.1 hypothetical protein [Pseudomonas aeruginosa]
MAASTGGTNGHAVAVEVDGVRYPSARAAARALGVGYSMVTARAHDPRHPNYRWLGATPARRELRPEDRRIAKAFIEPERWPNDGGARRAPVMDPNFDPPKVVRQVGWVKCMCCSRFHFSDDVTRARLCTRCSGLGGWPVGADPDEDF